MLFLSSFGTLVLLHPLLLCCAAPCSRRVRHCAADPPPCDPVHHQCTSTSTPLPPLSSQGRELVPFLQGSVVGYVAAVCRGLGGGGRVGHAHKETTPTAPAAGPADQLLSPTHTQATQHTPAPRPRAGSEHPTRFSEGSTGDRPGLRKDTGEGQHQPHSRACSHDPMNFVKGSMGDCPGSHKETNEEREVTQGVCRGFGTRPWFRFVCLWRRLLASRPRTFRPSVGPNVV